ncbi:early boundary activity protein 2-like isoform X2 [Zeugodacus cucurbitae]|uniref:early boundary activity protein 2-like isoform X2 n=1 Tax=Zeugodacus cucurbitae TaxID=28588 RepID=UPI0023D93A18|nr:early boundary activity protein 2-like isoform X2 [Zeugodacus cucurbitae]
MEPLPILSRAQLEAENEMMMKAKEPEDIAPLIEIWLVEYKDIPAMVHGELSAAVRETLEGKYKSAQRIAIILQKRAKKRQRGELNKMRNEHLFDEFKRVKAHLEEALKIISDVKERNELLQQLFDNQNVPTTRNDEMHVTGSTTSPTSWPNENNTPNRNTYVNADPRKRVLREMNREAELNREAKRREISTNVQSSRTEVHVEPMNENGVSAIQSEVHVEPRNENEVSAIQSIQSEVHVEPMNENEVSAEQSIQSEDHAEPMNENEMSATQSIQSEDHVEPMNENEVSAAQEIIVNSNNIINVVSDSEEIVIDNLDDIEMVAAYVTVSTSPETELVNMNIAESDRTATMSTPTPAPSPPLAASTPKRRQWQYVSSRNDENAVPCIVIGPNGTKVPTEKFEAISFMSSSAATRSLLCMIFPEQVLATHTLSGKPSPAFLANDRVRPQKGQLDPKKVEDIIHCVMTLTGCTDKAVRMTITTKCADSTKKFRRLSMTPRRSE